MYGIWRLFVDEEVRSFVLEGLDGFDHFRKLFLEFLNGVFADGQPEGQGARRAYHLVHKLGSFLRVAVLLVIVAQAELFRAASRRVVVCLKRGIGRVDGGSVEEIGAEHARLYYHAFNALSLIHI